MINRKFYFFLRFIPDKLFLQLKFYHHFHKFISFKNPVTFNEKLQWLKIYDRKPIYTKIVDKFEAKKFFETIFDKYYIIPTIGIYNNFDEIDFSSLPSQFVIKCTHDSGGVLVVKDKENIDIAKTKKMFDKMLKRNIFYKTREWPYKNVEPRIIIEKFLVDQESEELIDYKVHCFNGKAKFILVCSKRFSAEGLNEDFFDCDWNRLNIKRPNVNNNFNIKKPLQLNTLIELSEKIAYLFPFIRVDFYICNQHIYIGELTFYPASGMVKFEPDCVDIEIGNMLELPNLNHLK